MLFLLYFSSLAPFSRLGLNSEPSMLCGETGFPWFGRFLQSLNQSDPGSFSHESTQPDWMIMPIDPVSLERKKKDFHTIAKVVDNEGIFSYCDVLTQSLSWQLDKRSKGFLFGIKIKIIRVYVILETKVGCDCKRGIEMAGGRAEDDWITREFFGLNDRTRERLCFWCVSNIFL